VQRHRADVQRGTFPASRRVNEAEGKVLSLVDAPDKETATRVHREAHGLVAHTLYEVKPGA
jgi:hypothetical protein